MAHNPAQREEELDLEPQHEHECRDPIARAAIGGRLCLCILSHQCPAFTAKVTVLGDRSSAGTTVANLWTGAPRPKLKDLKLHPVVHQYGK